ncbi:hypothetical protein [Streptomyces chryseus]|uniref:Uncharacterized protein n=1 Tax=Streptomyces chryseus TaxID=68186 RepID=A0ABQ3E5B6_9ACTN|nr:hypothetical protein [Streptomyces chryseus]GHB26624.1 hypothetical protein GCM10010346_57760 [Streptomyces chryseus]
MAGHASRTRTSPEANQVVFRDRLRLAEDGAAVFDLGDSQIWFDLGSSFPAGIDSGWVEIRVEADKVALHPHLL